MSFLSIIPSFERLTCLAGTNISAKQLRYNLKCRFAALIVSRCGEDVAGKSVQYSQFGPSGWGIVAVSFSFATAELSQK